MQRSQTPQKALLASAILLALHSQAADTATTDNQQSVANNQPEEVIEEIQVFGSRKGNFTEITENTEKLVTMPGAMGDPLAAVFSLPGVVYGEGDMGAPAVRGSSPSDNLFLIDFMPAGYIFHDFSYSIFNDNIIQDFQLHSAGFGAEYASVTGAVFDVKLRDPKHQPITTTVDLSMLKAGLFVEGEVNDSQAFYLSGRKSLMHLFLEEDSLEEDGIKIKQAPEDHDFQFKYQWDINSDWRLTWQSTGAQDVAAANFSAKSVEAKADPDFQGDAELKRAFISHGLITDYYGDKGEHLKVGIGYLDDEDKTSWNDGNYFSRSGFKHGLVKAHYRFKASENHFVTIGGEYDDYTFDYAFNQIQYLCTEFDPDCILRRGERINDKQQLNQSEQVFFVNDSWSITPDLIWDLGVQYQYNDYTKESFTHPRTAVTLYLEQDWTLTTKAGRYNRFPDVYTVLPKIGNPDLKSPTADHFSFGVNKSLDNEWSVSVESYYKTLKNLPLALDEDAPDFAKNYVNGYEGKAYGLDLLVNKSLTDKWYGWFALSISKSERTNTRTQTTRDYHLDTPIVANLVLNYQYSEAWNFGARWTARSGSSYTPIVGVQDNPNFDDHYLPIYGEAYSDRLPVYSRLDLRFERTTDFWGYDGKLVIDIINALNQQPVISRDMDYERVNGSKKLYIEEEVGRELFPSIGFSVTF